MNEWVTAAGVLLFAGGVLSFYVLALGLLFSLFYAGVRDHEFGEIVVSGIGLLLFVGLGLVIVGMAIL